MPENKEKIESIDFDSLDMKSTKEDQKTAKWNIFDDFSTDTSLQEDLKKEKEKQEKDTFFYLSVLGKTFQVVFFIGIFVFIFLYAYIYVQKNENISSQSYLDPVCWFIAWEIELPNWNSCSSIAFLKSKYIADFTELKQNQTKKIIDILPEIYEKENFLQSKEVKFLLKKSENKLKVLEVLSKFDTMKNEFLWVDRKRIICENFEIHADKKILKMNCQAYMEGFSRVIGFEADKNTKNVSGTSISLANSFLNYIQKNNRDFILIDRQKVFKLEDVVSENGYTNTVKFDINLKINF